MSTVDLRDSSLCPQRSRTQRSRESCHIVTNSLASSCLNTHTLTHADTLCRNCGGRENAMLPWWRGVMSQHLTEKGAAGVLFLKNLCMQHSGSCRCKKIISARYFHISQSAHIAPKGSSNQPPHMENHSSWGPRDMQRYLDQQGGPFPNLGRQSTQAQTHTQT